MKKIFLLLNIVALCLLASCNPNEYAKFDDKDAFVAFGAATYAIDENGGSLKIPVTLASIKGIETTVKVAATDGSAKSGVNFNLKNGGQLTFNADNRTANVEIEIVDLAGEYTGDLKFTLNFSDLGGVNAGNRNSVTVTISDLDHPLSFILGDYTFSANKYSAAGPVPVTYTCTLMKDSDDDTKVWFYDMMGNPGWAGDDILYYGIVSDDKTTITVPLGQESEYLYGGTTPVTLLGLSSDLYGYDTGNLTVEIKDGGKVLDFGPDFGLWFYISGAGSIGTYLPGITATKVGE